MEVMVNSVQPIQTGTPALNRIGFAADEKAPEAAQPQVSLETPKDEFVKKKSHAVRNGALAGVAAGLAVAGKTIFNYIKKEGKRPSIVAIGILSTLLAAPAAAVGATIGKIIKMVSKKD